MNAEDLRPALSIEIRRAQSCDSADISEPLSELGYPSTAAQVERRIAETTGSTETAVFVAEWEGCVVGLLSFHRIPLFHADEYLGRITSLIVSTGNRGRGIGRRLLVAAEEYGAAHGCSRIEVTSGDHRADAHAFYERAGYRVDCRRFLKG